MNPRKLAIVALSSGFIISACCGAAVALAATDFVPLAEIPGLTKGVEATEGGIAKFLNNLYIFAIGAAVMLAVIMIIWGGLEYSMSESITAKGAGKSKIYNALFGLVLVLSPALVFTIINPKILNLNVNMPPLKTQPGTAGPQGACTNPAGCSTYSPTSDNWILPNQYQGVLPCSGGDCSRAVADCTQERFTITRAITGTAMAVCGDTVAQRYTGGATGVVTAPTSCPTGSQPAIVCTLSAGLPFWSIFRRYF